MPSAQFALNRSVLAGTALLATIACTSNASDGAIATGLPVNSASQPAMDAGSDYLPTGKGWSLVWSDEFSGDTLDRTKWVPEESCWGGGNEESQCYTDRPENIEVSGGRLKLKARKEEWTGPTFPPESRSGEAETNTKPYTSGKVRTIGLADWTYGRFAARIKLPAGQGTWSAFWMMPSDNAYGGWPLSGEIDILEAVNLGAACGEECVGDTEINTQGALHFGETWPDNKYRVAETYAPDHSSPSDDYHVYAVEWGEGLIRWFVNDRMFLELTAEDWFTASEKSEDRPAAPFDQPFFLALNLAVGGMLSADYNSGGINEATFPADLIVDWVRVYECEPDPVTALECMR